MRRPWLILLVAAAATCLGGAPAYASLEPFELVSGNPAVQLQADYAYDAAISADGSYVAFTGSVASKPGVYRTGANQSNRQLDVVALGSDTGAPSISETGQYVAFTTDDNPLTGAQEGPCTSVYVRNMSLPPSAPGAYQLVSARDGSTESLTYATPSGSQQCGSASAYRVAISGDGQKVAFTVLSASNLTAQGGAPAGETPTPADQVAVRDLEHESTELVSVTNGPGGATDEPVPGGAALTGAGIHAAEFRKRPTSDSTAAISADGSTVAWMGIDVKTQTGLQSEPPNGGLSFGYAEPLWRHLADGSPTRSVLAGDDSSASDCPPACEGGLDLLWNVGVETTGAQGPIYGSFTAANGFTVSGTGVDPLDVITPQLSANGETVALLSTQPDYGDDPQYRQGEDISPSTANAFVVDMAAGLTRAASIVRLTDWAGLNFKNASLAGPIDDIAISPDGERVAFITDRVSFPLAPPALITPLLSQASSNQLYEVNLPAGTMEMISEGYDKQPANEGIFDVSLSNSASTIAVASASSNLAYGAINEGSDVFVTREAAVVAGSAQSIGPPPPNPAAIPKWAISATASRGADGSLLLYVSVPGAGSLSANANAAVWPASHRSSKSSAQRSSASLANGNRAIGATASVNLHASLDTRRVAHAASKTRHAGVIKLRLSPLNLYRALVDSRAGLYATIEITFDAPGHPVLREQLRASFAGHVHRAKAGGGKGRVSRSHTKKKAGRA